MVDMVVVDTSIWVRHFRDANVALQGLLVQDRVLMHSLVRAELACGTPPAPRVSTLAGLAKLRRCREATIAETLDFLEAHQLYGRGCGFIDLSILASTLITPGAKLWTADARLHLLAKSQGVSYSESVH